MADSIQTRLTSAEYHDLPESSQIIELIDGELIMSPTPLDVHQETASNIYIFLRQNVFQPHGGYLRPVLTGVHFEEGHDFEPDIFWISPDNDRCVLEPEGRYWHGAPDLIVEILSPSTAYRDRGIKYEVYEKHGVREYWLVDPQARFLEVFRLENGLFKRLGVFGRGQTFASSVISIDVPVDALFG